MQSAECRVQSAVWCGAGAGAGAGAGVVCVVPIIEDTASLSWRVPRCTELNAAESKRHLNLQRQISGARQARQPTPVRGKRKGGTPSSILESPVPGGTNLFHRLGIGRPSPEQSSRL